MNLHLTARMSSITHHISLRAILYMCLASLCFTLVELVGQHMVYDVSPYLTVWGRYAVHLLFMLTVVRLRYKTKLFQTSNLKLQIVRSLTMLIMPICFVLAIQRLPANDVWSVYWLSPMIALVLSAWILHEPAGLIRWVAAFAGFVGVLLILQPDAGVFSLASILALGMGLCISLHLMLSRVLRADHPLVNLFHTALWVFVALSFFLPILWHMPTVVSLIGIVLIGLIGMIGLFALARSSELAPMPVVAAFAYTETVWTVLLNLILFGIVPGMRVIFGVLVVSGVTGYLVIHESRSAEANVLSLDTH